MIGEREGRGFQDGGIIFPKHGRCSMLRWSSSSRQPVCRRISVSDQWFLNIAEAILQGTIADLHTAALHRRVISVRLGYVVRS